MKNQRNWKGAVAAVVLIGLLAGCSQKDDSTKTAPVQPLTASDVQSNPNLPPQARAALLKHIQTPVVANYHVPSH